MWFHEKGRLLVKEVHFSTDGIVEWKCDVIMNLKCLCMHQKKKKMKGNMSAHTNALYFFWHEMTCFKRSQNNWPCDPQFLLYNSDWVRCWVCERLIELVDVWLNCWVSDCVVDWLSEWKQTRTFLVTNYEATLLILMFNKSDIERSP